MKKHGFTLIELMIVVAIIAIIAAIAIPNLLRSRMQSNETASIGNLKTIATAQNSYRASHDTYGDFALLTADTPPYLDTTWTEGVEKAGYTYSITENTANTWECTATHTEGGGERDFMADESGSIFADGVAID